MEAVTTRERENFMKNKKISKVVLSVLTSMSMLSSYSATIFAETPSQETGVAHEHDLIELERKSDLITNGGFDNNGGSWKKTGIYKTINGMKPIFIESQKKDFNKVYNDFKRSIDSNKGGLFLGVCRGKISEGMDFYDRQARAVFAFGIPYPSLKDVDVTLKRK